MFAAIPPVTQSYVLQSYPSSTMTTATTAMRMNDADTRLACKKFPCVNCSSVFSRKGGLTYHQKYECGQEPRFNCPYCVYCARHISNARRHVRKCHPGRNVYTVDLCKLQQHDPWGQASTRKTGIIFCHKERRFAKIKDAEWHCETGHRTSCEDPPLVEAPQLGRTVEISKSLLILFLVRYCSQLHEEYRKRARVDYTVSIRIYLFFSGWDNLSVCPYRRFSLRVSSFRLVDSEDLNCEDGR